MISTELSRRLDRWSAWWRHENGGQPLLIAGWSPPSDIHRQLRRIWPDATTEPDYEELARKEMEQLAITRHFGDSHAMISHSYGGRGTPMVMAAYLGGRVRFGEETVWVDPVIDDWEQFPVVFDPENIWVRRSRRLMEAQIAVAPDDALPWIPDLGDALTVFSLLRGVERLAMDLVEIPDLIEKKAGDYLRAFTAAHRYFHDICRRYPGDASCLCWAPGRTYMVQSDFSTMISPAMFRRFVVRELTGLSTYLEYMVWHLDGPEEIKHIDALLELPFIRAIQIQPGANRPTAVSDLWLAHVKRIQAAGKSLVVGAATREEYAILTRELSPNGLAIACGWPFTTPEEAEAFVREQQKG